MSKVKQVPGSTLRESLSIGGSIVFQKKNRKNIQKNRLFFKKFLMRADSDLI